MQDSGGGEAIYQDSTGTGWTDAEAMAAQPIDI
jgi:hypothetical protein